MSKEFFLAEMLKKNHFSGEKVSIALARRIFRLDYF
jgi:hypothetical protein